jgi:hypothetical protein
MKSNFLITKLNLLLENRLPQKKNGPNRNHPIRKATRKMMKMMKRITRNHQAIGVTSEKMIVGFENGI